MSNLFDVGFTGKAGSGKDTAAMFLRQSSIRYALNSFSASLKWIAKRFLGWDGIKDERGRALLQDIGMAVRRYDQDAWVKMAEENTAHTDNAGLSVLWTDVRFENEAELVRRRGGIVIRICRDGLHGEGMTEQTAADISECAMDGIKADYVISNNGSPEELRDAVFECVAAERVKREAQP